MKKCEVCGKALSKCQCKMRVCTNCGEEYKESFDKFMSRWVLEQEPYCSDECNETLGQVRSKAVK